MQKSAKNDSPQSIVDGIPNITGLEREVEKVTSSGDRLFAPDPHALDGVRSSFANALHMQQPMIPAGAGDLQHAPLVSNLQYMFDHINEGDNHNAPDFINCYSRMGDFITELVKDGKSPRIMLDYSGDLLWGLEQMGRTDVLDNLRKLACDPKYNHDVEFLGTMWSHAVAPSTPVPDLKLQIRAWQDHFASLFGTEALSRVRGFSPPEMALPNNPDVAYSYIKDLKDCGYRWLLVQEDTVENLDGSHVTDQHLPHMMVVRNSSGEEISMPVLIKTQGSDTKLVGQMQPLSEALTMQRQQLNGKSVPALVAQIGDGENGGVMMNEFPKIFMDKMSHLPADVPALNGTEYLERLADLGVTDKDFARVEPKGEAELWKHFSGSGRDALNKAIEATSKDDPRFTMDGGSWTDDRSWVNGYKDVLDDINKLSARFHEVFDGKKVDPEDKHYRTALMYLLVAETSCYRYWGTGRWTDYAKEICRRGQEVLKQDK